MLLGRMPRALGLAGIAHAGREEPMTVIAELPVQGHPEVALFAALSLGFFLGKRKVGSFSLGTSAGVLLAGVLIGQLRIPIPALLKGRLLRPVHLCGRLSGRPAILPRPEGSGRRLAALALILAVTGLLTAYAAGRLLGYDRGTAAGLLAGSLTQSAIIGSAGDAIARLDRGPEVKRLLSDNVSVAGAVTYLFGTLRRRLVLVPRRPAPAGRRPGHRLCRAGAGAAARTARRCSTRNPGERPVPYPGASGSRPALGDGGGRRGRVRPLWKCLLIEPHPPPRGPFRS